ncbi:MAG TPA: AgmX/PglI C-terminal domain-containing protein [Kofleriaceae bacterium]
MKNLAIAFVLLAACGGHKKQAAEPESKPDMSDDHSVGGGDNNAQVPPESIEQINSMLSRKQNVIARCLADAVERKEFPRTARGKVLVELTVTTSGAPSNVKIGKTSLESASLNECILGHIKSIVFPAIPVEFPTSYTYGLEAM